MSSGSTSAAIRSPATRSSAASSASTKATRSTRSRSSAPGPHPEPRLFPGEAGDQADPGLGPRPGRARRRRRGKVDRRAAAVGRLFEPREVHRLGVGRAAQLHGQGPGAQRRRQLVALFAVGPAGLHRALSVRQERSCSAAKSTAATTTASTTIGNEPQHDLFAASAPAPGCGSASRSPSSSASAPATRSSRTRSRSTRTPSSPISTATGRSSRVRSAQGRPLSVRRTRARP